VNDEIPTSDRERGRPDGLEWMCVGIMRDEFGRRKSRALAKAMIRLEAEDAGSDGTASTQSSGWRERIHSWVDGLRPRARTAVGVASILVIGFATYFLWSRGLLTPARRGSDWTCKVSDSIDARWAAKSAKPGTGDFIASDVLRLESGVVELTYAPGTTIAVEGPAEFKVTSVTGLELLSGKISANVPKIARGFTVKTPTATVVDLGTRFGTSVNSDHASEVDVFQGKVNVISGAGEHRQLTQGKALIMDSHSAVDATALPESAFPLPNLTVLARPQNCGFDVSGRAVTGGVPAEFGYWSGPAFVLTGHTPSVRTCQGAGMLQFLPSPSVEQPGDSPVWQVIDLRGFKRPAGVVEAKLSSMFNRIRSDSRAGETFRLSLAAFTGKPTDTNSLWSQRATAALAFAEKEITTDNDPRTWEKVEVVTKLPAEADFVIIEIRAIAPQQAKAPSALFPGHFADLVDFKLGSSLRASSISTSR
jgi:hypothetical protein